MNPDKCPNFNHRRSDAPVRFCPLCGAVVNAFISKGLCRPEIHDKRRRNQDMFCVDCGDMLRRQR